MATAAYKQFLASPNSSLLADNAKLHYITTLTSFTGAAEIIKHLTALRRQVTKKKEEAFNIVEGQDAIVAEVDTALEFLTSGGTYLPGLDDNFLSDRIAYLSITHFVSFDQAGKISQIRLQWDQGSLLKQLEIIGKTGRNWPIKDSREQLSLIQSSLKSSGKFEQEASHNDLVVRNRQNSKNALRDPHASLQLFGNREEIEAADATSVLNPYAGNKPRQRDFTEIIGDNPQEESNAASVLNPYAGNKPRQRDFTEILGDNPQEESDALFHRPVSPSKSHHHPEMRIYDGSKDVEEEEPKPRKDPLIRPHPTKYNHFEFADGSDPQDAPKRGVDFDKKPKTKHDSQWSFDDFTTPHKSHPSRGARSQEVRHWDPENLNEDPADAGPGRARRDAETHFELQDDGERDPNEQSRPSRPRGAGHNEGLGLYKNQLFDEEDPDVVNKRTSALGNITNLKDRGKDFDAHFTMTDKSPAPERTQQVPEGKKKAVKMMDHNWEVYEQSPLKENAPQRTKVEGGTHLHIAGDGMGGKRGSTRNWLYGDDDEENTKPAPGRKGNQNAAQKSFWDF